MALTIVIAQQDLFNSVENTFSVFCGASLRLEHSLISISKWEAAFKKPFLSDVAKTTNELIYYIVYCMNLEKPDPLHESLLSSPSIEEVQVYMEGAHSATSFLDLAPRRQRPEIITSELVYYWMIHYNIPIKAEQWHLNRLLTLIKICSIKENPDKQKMGAQELREYNRNLNAARLAEMRGKG